MRTFWPQLCCIIAAMCVLSGVGLAGTDVPVDPDPNHAIVQNEISLTLVPNKQPNKRDILLAAYNDFAPNVGLGYSYSPDGGTSWSPGQLQFPTNPNTGVWMMNVFDPTATADTQGNAYIGHIAWDAFGWSGMFVHTSADGGVTWSPPVALAVDPPAVGAPDPNFRLNDRCQITTDTYGGSPYLDNVYVAWIKDRGNDPNFPYSDLYVSCSNSLGAAFTPAQRINDANLNLGNMPVPAVAQDGAVYVSWLDYDVTTGGKGNIYLDKSTDGGITWGTDTFVKQIDLPPLNVTGNDGNMDARAKGAPVLATSPTDANILYIVYAADPDITDVGNGPDEADIFFIKSTDGGNTWGQAERVNDDLTQNDQILPWVDVKLDGTVDIAWYDRRNDVADAPAGDLYWDVYLAKTTDDGNTFSTNVQINDQSFLTPLRGMGEPWMGEYLGLSVDANTAYVVFTSSVSDVRGDLYFDFMDNLYIGIPVGDMDGSGKVDSDDINPFVLALTDPNAYIVQYGMDPNIVGDCDGSGKIDSDDITPFVGLVTSGQVVPEPGCLAVLLVGGTALLRRKRR